MTKYLFTVMFILISGAAMSAPPPGHPSVDDAAKVLNIPKQEPLGTLPYRGRVLQAIPSNAYTYIEVETEEGALWLAAPEIGLSKGDTIRYGDGTVMTNFYSKEQQIIFSKVIFLGRVVRVDD